MSQILLDNPARGSTTLLGQCTTNQQSSQLQVGSAVGDNTGDLAFNAGRRLKQWAADVNTQTALIFGNYLAAVAAPSSISAPINNWDPTGGSPGNLVAISRLDINPTLGSVYLTGMVATQIADEKRIILRNIGSFNVTLAHQNTGSNQPNQFYGPGGDLILQPGMAITTAYYLITSGPTYWVLLP